jgi:ABC-type phosphate transport system substrate-binding protein
MRNIRKSFVALGIAVVASLSTSSVALAESASGSGATFPQQFLASATAEFNKATGHNVTYANPGGGSSKGKADFKGGLTDFGGSDSGVSSSQAASFDWTYVPYVGGPIAVAYRLDDLGGATLSLSQNTINAIFTGEIDNWSHPSIVADMKANPTWANTKKKSDYKGASVQWTPTGPFAVSAAVTLLPAALKSAKGKKIEVVDSKTKKAVTTATVAARGEISLSVKTKTGSEYSVKVDGKEVAKYKRVNVTLPSKTITVVYRSDGSGTTNNFCNYLKNATNAAWAVNDAFTSCIPGGSSKVASFGSRFQGQSGSANVSNYIADNSGTIGYTESSFVSDAARAAKGMKSALIKNAAGRYVAPTAANASSSMGGADIDAKGFVTFNYKQTSNPTAYPITAITYGLAKLAKSPKNDVVREFFRWILESYGPANADALGYAPLGGELKTKALALAKTVSSK